MGPNTTPDRTMTRCRFALLGLLTAMVLASSAHADDPALEFFETKIRPALIEHCYKCHSAEAKKIRGGLRLDGRAGWQAGGDSGKPAIVPGKPDESPLIRSIRHDAGEEAMPPNQSKLPDRILADFTAWVKMGAPDPRVGAAAVPKTKETWEAVYQARLAWWSLQPVAAVKPPAVKRADWARTDVDRLILAGLEAKGLTPQADADRRTLARRLSFALTGLPPTPDLVERFAADPSANAYEALVQTLQESPHFGEHWARHWMDVVHYADTHGYEWDTPAKHAWRYRDYLTRAYQADVPFDRLILEQIAGDLIEPRIDPKTGVNEALLGPMALRLGERRHGDNAGAEGVTQEAVANVIDTVGKGFLGTTIACAQCHDHKLDAVAQRDFYALAGVFMSTRWHVRNVDAVDPNVAVLSELRNIKAKLRAELAKNWIASREAMLAKIRAIPDKEKAAAAFPETLTAFALRLREPSFAAADFAAEQQRLAAKNQANLKLLADFTVPDGAAGWQWDGSGMRHGLVREGEIAVADEGSAALAQFLPAGRWSHAWSQRLGGAVRSPLFEQPIRFSVGVAGGKQAAHSFIVDQAFHSERMAFLNQPRPGWLNLIAGNFDSLEGSIDKRKRRVYFELVTKGLNNYYPPRTGYGGVSEKDLLDERSWFGVTRVYEHAAGKGPVDDLSRFAPLFKDPSDPAGRVINLVMNAIERWNRDACLPGDASLLDEALRLGWLANDTKANPELANLVNLYRQTEAKLQTDRTIGSMAEWNEGRNERIGIRGSYNDLGDEVPRGVIRFLGGPAARANADSSGRLELARSIASPKNPLTARVYVNRVWLHLFGEGLVRTPDDFGHLGQRPSHPELLDYLAKRFVDEGWSTKKLITMLVNSAVWKQASTADKGALQVDPENRLWHHLPMRRLEAEAIRDALLLVSGRLDPTVFGPPIDPHRAAEDAAKRLFKGPLDGNGRRSIYTKMTLMEPPRFLALFNQPLPMLTVGKRDITNVPDQALALLNDSFVVAMAKHWSARVLKDGAASAEDRAGRMFAAAFGRPPSPAEVARLTRLLARSAELHGQRMETILASPPVWLDFAHALFNLKEFVYVL
jgi:hypothetical protein